MAINIQNEQLIDHTDPMILHFQTFTELKHVFRNTIRISVELLLHFQIAQVQIDFQEEISKTSQLNLESQSKVTTEK